MKTLTSLILAAFATYASVSAAITKGSQTLVLKEINGVPGNECLTFRNNGEIVDAACVLTAIDRRITPSTSSTGQSILFIERTFGAGFRDDLIGKQPCVGFNGTDFKAEDCDAVDTQFVALVGDELRSGDACQSGHDGRAQITVDTTGVTCAKFTILDADSGAEVTVDQTPVDVPVAEEPVAEEPAAEDSVTEGPTVGECATQTRRNVAREMRYGSRM